ncbi:MAG: type II CAAX prenyl endopeptidase Rce1 family protein [Planctomycetota bacterium]
MNRRHLLLVYAKDAQQLLRDRRTLFVNLVLPVLLYPILALIAMQVVQLTRPGPEQAPRIATALLPPAISAALPIHDQPSRLRALDLDRLQERHLQDLALQEHPQALLDWLREYGCSLAVVALPQQQIPQDRILVLGDNAHRDYPQALRLVRASLEASAEELRQAILDSYDIPPELRQPLLWEVEELAAAGEAARTQLAGVIPLILLLMALSGAFYPALDLIAGERERGTLETLLSWPGDRRAIFSGKLLLVMTASLASVVLNLISLGLTAGLVAAQLPAEAGAQLTGGIAIDPGTLAAGFMMLLPLTLTLATISLALAGIAASYKEAQNYLSPLLLLVMTPAMVSLLPHVDPSFTLDMLPVIGPLVVLKNALQTGSVAWAHALFTTAVSTVICAVVVAWAVRLLAQEHFLYPQLIRHGWGRFSGGAPRQAQPRGVEVLLLFAACLAAFFLSGGLFAAAPAWLRVAGPLLCGIAAPTLLFTWLGGFRAGDTLALRDTTQRNVLLLPLLLPVTLGLAMALAILQLTLVPAQEQVATGEQIREILRQLHEQGGLPLLVLTLAVTPAVSEELLFRGALLHGLRYSLGRTSAVLVSSFLFAAMHLSPARFLPQFALGVILAAMTLRTRSILPAMLLHAAHNATAVLMDPSSHGRPGTPLEDDPSSALLRELSEQAPALAPLLAEHGLRPVMIAAALAVPLFAGLALLVIRGMQGHHTDAALSQADDDATR